MKLSLRLGAVFLGLLLAGCPSPDEPPPPPPYTLRDAEDPAEPQQPEAAGEDGVTDYAHIEDRELVDWLVKLDRLPDAGFAAAAPDSAVETQLALYVTQSAGASGFNLLPAVDPHRGAKDGAAWSAQPAKDESGVDTVRCRYRALGRDLELRESWNLQVVTVALEQPLDRAGLTELLAQVVRSERMDGTRWRFELPAELKLPLQLTNAGAPSVAELTNRDQRVDVLLTADRLRLVFYKRVDQLAVFNQDHTWFRASCREALQN